MSAWAGRKVARLTVAVLHAKGTTCHLCGLPGADSPDHEPPRSVLLAQGVPDPDVLMYLHPSHLVCNKRRRARPLTDELRAELHRRRLDDPDMRRAVPLSPRFLQNAPPGRKDSFPLSPPERKKTDQVTKPEWRTGQ